MFAISSLFMELEIMGRDCGIFGIFRNYKDDEVLFGEKVKRLLVRTVIYAIIVFIVLQLLYVLVAMIMK